MPKRHAPRSMRERLPAKQGADEAQTGQLCMGASIASNHNGSR